MEKHTIKIAHTADIHLRRSQYKHESRRQDFLNGFLAAIDAAAKAGCHYMLVAGDIVDTNNPGAAVVLADLDDIEDFARAKEVVLICTSGNHDTVKPHWITRFVREQEVMDVRFTRNGGFTLIDNKHKELWANRDTIIGRSDPHPLTVYGIPYCSAKELKAKLESWDKRFPMPDIVMWHGEIKQFCGYPKPTAFDMEDLPAGCCKLFAVGDQHIHEKKTTSTGIVVAYPGSTELCSSSEDPQKKIWVHTFETEDNLHWTLAGSESVPFKTRAVHKFTIKTQEDLDAACEAIEPGSIAFAKFDSAVLNVRARLKGAAEKKNDKLETIIRVQALPKKNAMEVIKMLRPGERVRTASQFVHDEAEKLFDVDEREDLEPLCADILDPEVDHKLAIDKFVTSKLKGKVVV